MTIAHAAASAAFIAIGIFAARSIIIDLFCPSDWYWADTPDEPLDQPRPWLTHRQHRPDQGGSK